MNDQQRQIAELCKQSAEDSSMDFLEIVKQLTHVGFERYIVDFCGATVTYYLPSGESIMLKTYKEKILVAEYFDTKSIQTAIKDAQMKVAGYTYNSFREQVMKAGCIGYIVSFLGERVVYFGRTGENHVEYFPK